jgi:hypothetical protein
VRALAVDPGPHCGLAARLDDKSLQHLMIHNDIKEVLKYVYTLQPHVIIVERFATAGRISRDGLDTVEIQGAVLGLAYVLGSQLYWQSPMDRKPFEAEARMLIGANRSKIQSHAVDATSHLLRWEWMEEHNRQRSPFLS